MPHRYNTINKKIGDNTPKSKKYELLGIKQTTIEIGRNKAHISKAQASSFSIR